MLNYRSLNQFEIIGSVYRSEVATSRAGAQYLKLTVRTRSLTKARDEAAAQGKKWEISSTWHDFFVFSERAVKLAPHLATGALVRVTGAITYTKRDDKSKVMNFSVDAVDLLAEAPQGTAAAAPAAGGDDMVI